MDSSFEDSPVRCEPEEAGVAHGAAAADGKAARLSPSPASTSSAKRSRRSVQKRVVSVPIAEADASRPKGAGEGAPPSDSWAWRKYGQKPIKGSPYPRGYYRCSSSKGCPARKQVERSRVDPTMLVITYSSDHNHAWPLPKNHHHHHSSAAAASTNPKAPPEEEPAQVHPSPPDPSDQDERFSDLIADETSSLMMADEFGWFSDVGSSSSTSPPAAVETLLYAPPIYGGAAMLCADERELLGGGGAEEEEEDSLFAGLGELPEFSMVFRRGLAAATASTG